MRNDDACSTSFGPGVIAAGHVLVMWYHVLVMWCHVQGFTCPVQFLQMRYVLILDSSFSLCTHVHVALYPISSGLIVHVHVALYPINSGLIVRVHVHIPEFTVWNISYLYQGQNS